MKYFVLIVTSFLTTVPALAYISDYHLGDGLSEQCGNAIVAAYVSDPDLNATLSVDVANETTIEISDADKVEIMVDTSEKFITALFQVKFSGADGDCEVVKLVHY